MITPAEFDKWFRDLGFLDKMNFQTLIGLPNATKLIKTMPDGQYKDMATFLLNQAKLLILEYLEI
jgi:hypothetical protein